MDSDGKRAWDNADTDTLLMRPGLTKYAIQLTDLERLGMSL